MVWRLIVLKSINFSVILIKIFPFLSFKKKYYTRQFIVIVHIVHIVHRIVAPQNDEFFEILFFWNIKVSDPSFKVPC